MLSQEEYDETVRSLANIPPEITGKRLQNYKQLLKKKLKEHKYASIYKPFEPLPYFIYFINRATSETKLRQAIQIATTTSIYTLDIESVQSRNEENKPTLIQVQLILPNHTSVVLVFEACHMPENHTLTFTLIKQLFQIIFGYNKEIFIWGKTQELHPFIRYGLFSIQQLDLPKFINFQEKFAEQWQIQNPHKVLNDDCLCEICIGRFPGQPWSVQDAVALLLHEYLDKRLTISHFDIGLDPELIRLNSSQIEYRQTLTTYAINDCLCMQRLLIQLEINKKHLNKTVNKNQLHEREPIAKLKSIYEPESIDESRDTQTHTDHRKLNLQLERISDDDNEVKIIEQKQLRIEQRKKIHNRSCTLRQRKRDYRYELVFKDIDSRFKIRQIKNILRQNNILFTAINTSISSTNRKTTLYVGIKDKTKLTNYENITKTFFTTNHFNSLPCESKQTHSSSYIHHHH